MPAFAAGDAIAELLVQTVLEALDAVGVGAGEDRDELAVAVVAEDVFLAAELRERRVELAIVAVALDPVDGERRVELRDRVDVALQAVAELGIVLDVVVLARR